MAACVGVPRRAYHSLLPAVAASAVLIALTPRVTAQPALDGWGSAGSVGNPAPVYSQSTTLGVTTGVGALKTVNPQSGFWGPSTGNFAGTPAYNALRDANRLSFDVTMIGTEMSGDGSNFSGFAQTNELSIQLFSNPGGTLPNGINAFIQRTWAGSNGTDSRNHAAQWAGDDGTRTITYDLGGFTAVDPTDNQTKSVSQILTEHPDVQLVKINFVQQMGGGAAPGAWYWDNVGLLDSSGGTLATIGNFEPIPEPTSLALSALAVPSVVLAIRRRRVGHVAVEA